MRNMLLRVDKIQFHKDLDQYYIFTATVYKIVKKTGMRKQKLKKITGEGQGGSGGVGEVVGVGAVQ